MDIKCLLALPILAISAPAIAGDSLYFDLYGASVHTRSATEKGTKYNGENPGFGLSYTHPLDGRNEIGAKAGFFKNSIEKQSVFAGATYDYCFVQPHDGSPFKACAGAFAGAITGYEEGKVRPALAPMLTLGTQRYQAQISAFPTQDRDAGVVAISLRMKLNK